MRYEIFSCDANKLFPINSIGYSEDINVTRFGPGQRDLYIVHYVISGIGYFNGHKVNKGQGFLITPGMPEFYYPDEENPWSFLWIIFSNSYVEKIFEKYNADLQTHIFEYGSVHSVIKAVNCLFGSKQLYTSAELFEKFLNIFNNQGHTQQNRQKSADMYYNYAVNYIHSNLFHPITIDEITRVLGITQPYLYNIFRDKCGMSPKKYIISSKLTKAKQLLTETELPICEVSASVGYLDPLSFSKQFKQFTGYSPTAFREL